MNIEANIWKPSIDADGDIDGDLFEGQHVEVERSDDDEIGVHLKISYFPDWVASAYLTRTMAGALAAELLRAAERA